MVVMLSWAMMDWGSKTGNREYVVGEVGAASSRMGGRVRGIN